MQIKTWQADALLLGVTAVWGATFPMVKSATNVAAGGVPTYWFLAARFTLAAVLLGLIFWRRLQHVPLQTWFAGGFLGLMLFAGYAFQTFGLGLTTSSKAAFITGLCVVMVPVLAVIWLKQKPSPGTWLGVAVAAAGLALLSLNGDLKPTTGDLLVFAGAVAFAMHIVGVGLFTEHHDPVALSVVQIAAAGLLSSVLHLWQAGTLAPGVARVDWFAGPGQVLLALAITAVLATAVAFLLQNVLQPYTTPTHTALIFSAEPVWGAIFAYFLAGEVLTGREYLGAALIVAGMLLAELRPSGHAVEAP